MTTLTRDKEFPASARGAEGKEARQRNYEFVIIGQIGFYGFFAGPDVHILEYNALTEPLLARLPVDDDLDWRIGHFKRSIPDGYIETLKTGENLIVDENLADFYDKLILVTRGDLFAWDRIVEIWRMNTGYYDDLLDSYHK